MTLEILESENATLKYNVKKLEALVKEMDTSLYLKDSFQDEENELQMTKYKVDNGNLKEEIVRLNAENDELKKRVYVLKTDMSNVEYADETQHLKEVVKYLEGKLL